MSGYPHASQFLQAEARSGTRLLLAGAYRASGSQKSVAVRNLKASDKHDTSTCCWLQTPQSCCMFPKHAAKLCKLQAVVSMKTWQQSCTLSSERRDTWQEPSSPRYHMVQMDRRGVSPTNIRLYRNRVGEAWNENEFNWNPVYNSGSELFYDWRLTVNQFGLATNPSDSWQVFSPPTEHLWL